MSGLSRKEAEISVLVDGRERRFRLRSQPIAKQLEHLEIQERGREQGLAMAEQSFSSETTLTDAHRAYITSLVPVLTNLLREPADQGKPLTPDECWLIDSNDILRVIAEQEEITNMASIMGKSLALQQTAGRRMLQRSRQDGELLALPSPKQVSPPTVTPPSTNGLLSNAWKRITTLASSFGGNQRSRSG